MSASLDPASASGAPSPQHVYAARMAASTDRAQPTKGGGPSPKKGSFLKRGTSGGGRNGNSGGSFSSSRQVKQDSGEHREGRILEDEEPGEGGSLGTPRWAEWRGWVSGRGRWWYTWMHSIALRRAPRGSPPFAPKRLTRHLPSNPDRTAARRASESSSACPSRIRMRTVPHHSACAQPPRATMYSCRAGPVAPRFRRRARGRAGSFTWP